jgi:hypothetical protein
VHTENLFPPANIGQWHDNLSVKSPRPQQCRIEHIGAICRSDNNDAFVTLEPIHFYEQLIEGLLAFVMAAAKAGAAVAPDGVDLVYEYDARGMLFCLFEHVAHAGGAHTYKHLYEIRAGNRKKGHLRLTGYRARQECLPGAGRANHQHTFRNLPTEALKLGGVPQEVNDFADLLLGFLDACHIAERHIDLIFAEQARPTLPERHCAASAAGALHLPHEINPHRYQQ